MNKRTLKKKGRFSFDNFINLIPLYNTETVPSKLYTKKKWNRIKEHTNYHLSKKLYKSFSYYRQKKLSPSWGARKPEGLWYSCGPEWEDFVKGERLELYKGVITDAYKYIYVIEPNYENIKKISNYDEVLKFISEYGYFFHQDTGFIPIIDIMNNIEEYKKIEENSWETFSCNRIDWRKLQDNGYSGIEICPNLENMKWPKNSDFDYEFLLDWYYSWDVASGCIWKKNGIQNIYQVEFPYISY